jgi:hypothetical protein
MFDTILINKRIRENYKDFFTCPKCSSALSDNFQTHDLYDSMDTYYLTYDEMSNIILVELGKPSIEHVQYYTDEEIKKNNENMSHAIFELKKGDFFYLPEAYLPENRKQLSMGNLPHQYIEICDICDGCKHFVNLELKFTDGILTGLRRIENEYK